MLLIFMVLVKAAAWWGNFSCFVL